MVLLHALGDTAQDWAPIALSFESQFRVAAVDLRGYGESSWPGGYGFEVMRDDVIAVLDALDLHDITLVGHSMGGVVSYLLAHEQPDRIRRLIVEDVCPPFPRTRAIPTRPEGELLVDWNAVEAIVEEMNDPTRRWWPALSDITAPTLLLGGGPTSTIPQPLLAKVSRRVAECTLLTIAAGHNIHQDRPREFSDAVARWLTDNTVRWAIAASHRGRRSASFRSPIVR